MNVNILSIEPIHTIKTPINQGLMFKIYVADLRDNISLIRCTEIKTKAKLKKQLKKTYGDLKIIHMTNCIPITKKTTANKSLKDVFQVNAKKPFDGKCSADQKIIINGVDAIAKKCIEDEKQRVAKDSRTSEYYIAQSQRIREASYLDPDPMSSDSESENSLDGFIVGDDVYD